MRPLQRLWPCTTLVSPQQLQKDAARAKATRKPAGTFGSPLRYLGLGYRRPVMSKAETIVLLVILIMTGLVIGNMVFQAIVDRQNPPIGRFVQCNGMRLHYIDRGDSRAPCAVLLHGNG